MRILILVFLIFASTIVQASPSSLTYQGRIVRSNGEPLEFNNVGFIFELTSPSGTCVIYREQKNGVNMTNSGGVFDVAIGSGVRQFPTAGTSRVTDYFVNGKAYSCGDINNNDTGATYSAVSGDGRRLRVSFWDGSGWQVISPDNEIRSVPYASYSLTAEKIGSISADNVARKTDLPSANCSANEVLTFSGGAFSCVPDQLGTSSGGIVSIAGETGSSQSLAVNTTGTALTWTSASNVHTLKIPLAATSGVAAGLISNSDYDSFSSKQDALGFTPLNPTNNLSDLDNAATARSNLGLSTAGGDLTGSLPNPTVAKLQSKDITLSSLANKNVLFYDGAKWINKQLAISDISGVDLNDYVGFSALPTNCSASKTLVFVSPANTFTCSDISIASTQVTGLAASATTNTTNADNITSGTLSVARLPSSITSAMWSESSGDIYRTTGNVGIGTDTPGEKLSVDGVIESVSGGFKFPDGTIQVSAATGSGVAGPSFYVHKNSTNQSYGSDQRLTWSTELFDTNNNFASHRFTPTVAGKYIFNLNLASLGGACTGYVRAKIKKNGVVVSQTQAPPDAFDHCYANSTVIVDMNGTSDYVEAFGDANAGTFSGDPAYTNFQGALLAPLASGSVAGTGTADAIPKWTNSTTLGSSIVYDNGTNVGVGTDTPAAKLHVNGSALATAWNTSSDVRLKENIETIQNPLDKILALRGVEFDWRRDIDAPTKHDEAHDIGVIAQEVEQVFPEAVTSPKDGYKSVAYSKLVAPLIESVKTLYYRIVGIEDRQAQQQRRIASVESDKADKIEVDRLREENEELKKENELIKKRLEKIEKSLSLKE